MNLIRKEYLCIKFLFDTKNKMPYTEKNYPITMKNLDEVIRRKAIDMLNAMLADGYDEENAIPISIAQAKKWRVGATQKELQALEQKDITKHKKSSDAARLQDANVKVFYDWEQKQWAVKSIGAKKVSSYHATKKDAKEKANVIANNRESRVITFKKDATKFKGGEKDE